MIEVTLANAAEYLRDRGFVPASGEIQVEELGWGISNVVLKVTTDQTSMVCKQSLPKLRVVDDWPFLRERIFVERDCMRALGRILKAGSVPEVLFSDEENFFLAMSCAPPGGILWEQALLEGQVDLATARRVGELLASMHLGAALDEQARQRFADPTVFIQGRIDPYHRTTARAHPDLADMLEAEVQRMLARRLTLVHGDFSPKNMFVYSDHVLLLDFEVAHWGDPAFDAAFCTTHLVLNAIKFPARHDVYLNAASQFWNAYARGVTAGRTDSHPLAGCERETERATVVELGCLLLARIDGKSKIGYITDDATKDLVRSIAREILVTAPDTMETTLLRIAARLTT